MKDLNKPYVNADVLAIS